MILIAYGLGVLGFACLALSLPKHWQDVFARDLENWQKWILRAVGWALIAAAFALCAAQWGLAIGLFAWVGTLAVAALPVTLLLAIRRVG